MPQVWQGRVPIPLTDRDMLDAEVASRVIAKAFIDHLSVSQRVSLTTEARDPLNQLMNAKSAENLNQAMERIYDWCDAHDIWIEWLEEWLERQAQAR